MPVPALLPNVACWPDHHPASHAGHKVFLKSTRKVESWPRVEQGDEKHLENAAVWANSNTKRTSREMCDGQEPGAMPLYYGYSKTWGDPW